jgi:hypothetical protein
MVKLSIIASSVLVKCNPCTKTINHLNAVAFFSKFVKQGT